MEIGIERTPIKKYVDARYNAYWTKIGIDTNFSPDNGTIKDYKLHLMDCEKHPTIGLLARKKFITGTPMNYPETANRNIRFMERQPEIRTLLESIDTKIKELYPKTKKIREYIIDNERVIFDRIEKNKKYSLFNKLAILCKKIK